MDLLRLDELNSKEKMTKKSEMISPQMIRFFNHFCRMDKDGNYELRVYIKMFANETIEAVLKPVDEDTDPQKN